MRKQYNILGWIFCIMSSALASAKRRRSTPTEAQQSKPTNVPPTVPHAPPANPMATVLTQIELEKTTDMSGIIEEYEARFKMIAEEIANIKDALLKVQTFSIELNQSLFDYAKILNPPDSTNEAPQEEEIETIEIIEN